MDCGEKRPLAPWDLFTALLVTAIALIISKGRLTVSTDIVIAGSLFGLVPGAAIVSST